MGSAGVVALANGHYVVASPFWDNAAAADVGAVTWGNGASGTFGLVTAGNSLVGGKANDFVGFRGVTALTNGAYVVISPSWANGLTLGVGALTWGNGASGLVGVVSPSNSLVGSTADDQVGGQGVTALTNGNYVVRSLNWDNGPVTNAGAATWGNGAGGTLGLVSPGNSLVGGAANNNVGINGAVALANGHYVVLSSLWANGAATGAGAATWGSGTSGVSGLVSPGNSLVGGAANDFLGSGGVVALPNGEYTVHSPAWDNGATANAAAATLGSGANGVSGV